MKHFPETLRALLSKRKSRVQAEWDARHAAVLLPIYFDAGEWHLVYTRRTDHVENHRGQVAFPGGLVEQGDRSAQETALREAEEELGLRPESVEILGALDTLLTVTQFQIVPFVGQIEWPYKFQPNHDEVAAVFSVPLSWLQDSENLELRSRFPIPEGPEVPVYYFKPYQGEVIWGATARITLNFLEIIRAVIEGE